MTERPIPRFKLIRKKLGMSQQQFADYLTNDCNAKTSKATIGRYEAGIVYPSKHNLEKYATALQVTPYYLSGEGPDIEDVPGKIMSTLAKDYFNQGALAPAIRAWISS